MATNFLTPLQVARYAQDAGFKGNALITAVAISGAESSWNADAIGDVGLETSYWGPSVGLWQIRSIKSETGTGQDRDPSKLTNPLFNAQAAYQISSSGTNFSPWTTYFNGAYLSYMAQAKAAVAQLTATPSAPSAVVTSVEKQPLLYILGAGLMAISGVYIYRVYKRRTGA